ncbi:MAG: P-II family nitrogen regulator [Candidatus Nitrosotenuis sp.]
MKRIEAFFQFGKLESVIEEIERIGVKGTTVFYARGRGEAERARVLGERGTQMHTSQFNVIDGIVTIVDDSIAELVEKTIKKYASAEGGRGIIVTSNVENVLKF